MTENHFRYNHDGRMFALPHFKDLPFGAIRKLRNVGTDEQAQADAFFSLIELAAPPEALAIIDTMNIVQVGEMMTAWQAASGVDVGESSASSTSSTDTGRPSSTTLSVQDGPSTTSPTG